MSPARYARQVENLRDALAEADPAHAAAYRANAERYLAQVREMEARTSRLSQSLAGRDCATFHDSAAYLAADLSLHVTAALSIGEERRLGWGTGRGGRRASGPGRAAALRRTVSGGVRLSRGLCVFQPDRGAGYSGEALDRG